MEQIISTKTDHGFFILLNKSKIQKKLHQLLGSIPDGQRNACWSSLLIILPKNTFINNNNDDNNNNVDVNDDSEKNENNDNDNIQKNDILNDTFEDQLLNSRLLNCIFSLGNILSSLGLSVQQFRPVPENVMVLLISEVILLF